jgi:hypothetical protein
MKVNLKKEMEVGFFGQKGAKMASWKDIRANFILQYVRPPVRSGRIKKERGPEPRPLLQATILFHLRGHLIIS